MARLRFPGRPGHRFDRISVKYFTDDIKNLADPSLAFLPQFQSGLRTFRQLVGASDEEDEFDGFTLQELKAGEKKLHKLREEENKIIQIDTSPQSGINVKSTRLSRARLSLEDLPTSDRTRSNIKAVVRKSYKDLIKEGLATPSKSHSVVKVKDIISPPVDSKHVKEKHSKKERGFKPCKFKLDYKHAVHKTVPEYGPKVKKTEKDMAKFLLEKAKQANILQQKRKERRLSNAKIPIQKKGFVLPTQSSRSSRVIIPNKRFLEEDNVVSIVQKKLKSSEPFQQSSTVPLKSRPLSLDTQSNFPSVGDTSLGNASFGASIGSLEKPLIVDGKRDRKPSLKVRLTSDVDDFEDFREFDSDFSGKPQKHLSLTSPLAAPKLGTSLFSGTQSQFQKSSDRQRFIGFGSGRKQGVSIVQKAKLQLNRAALNKSKAALAKSLKAEMKREAKIVKEHSKQQEFTGTSLPDSLETTSSQMSDEKKKVGRKKKKRCVVCGQTSDLVSCYSGMIIMCSPCRFFALKIRNKAKHEACKIVCIKKGSCKITPDTKSKCRYCRIKKLIEAHVPHAELLHVLLADSDETKLEEPASKHVETSQQQQQTPIILSSPGYARSPPPVKYTALSPVPTLRQDEHADAREHELSPLKAGEGSEKRQKKKRAFKELLRTKQEKSDASDIEDIEAQQRVASPTPIPGSIEISPGGHGPRIKHVCRNAAVVLGKVPARFPEKSELRLSALPTKDKVQLWKKDEEDKAAALSSDDDRPMQEIIQKSSDSVVIVKKSPPKSKLHKKMTGAGGLHLYKRKLRCKKCSGCLSQDCGKCRHCIDKPKFGGPGTCKQACVYRQCKNPIVKRSATAAFINLKKSATDSGTDSNTESLHNSPEKTKKIVISQMVPRTSVYSHFEPLVPGSQTLSRTVTGLQSQTGTLLENDSQTLTGTQSPRPRARDTDVLQGTSHSSRSLSSRGQEVRRLEFDSSSHFQLEKIQSRNQSGKINSKMIKKLESQQKYDKKQGDSDGQCYPVTLQSVNPASRQWGSALSQPRHHPIKVDFKSECDINSAWNQGMALTMSVALSVRTLCFLCGSAGKHDLIYCNICCEPYHEFCLDECEQPIPGHYDDWCCSRCQFCYVCGRHNSLLQCDKCLNTYHPECLGPNYPTKPSKKKKIWICTKCVKCKSCGATTPGTSSNATWTYDFSLCYECGQLMDKGNFCPICRKCYSDDDWESKMIQCNLCESWVHSRCEGLTDEMYEILSYLPEDLSFYCRKCHPVGCPEWESTLKRELRMGLENILQTLILAKSAQHILKYDSKKKSPPKPAIKSSRDQVTPEHQKCRQRELRSRKDQHDQGSLELTTGSEEVKVSSDNFSQTIEKVLLNSTDSLVPKSCDTVVSINMKSCDSVTEPDGIAGSKLSESCDMDVSNAATLCDTSSVLKNSASLDTHADDFKSDGTAVVKSTAASHDSVQKSESTNSVTSIDSVSVMTKLNKNVDKENCVDRLQESQKTDDEKSCDISKSTAEDEKNVHCDNLSETIAQCDDVILASANPKVRSENEKVVTGDLQLNKETKVVMDIDEKAAIGEDAADECLKLNCDKNDKVVSCDRNFAVCKDNITKDDTKKENICDNSEYKSIGDLSMRTSFRGCGNQSDYNKDGKSQLDLTDTQTDKMADYSKSCGDLKSVTYTDNCLKSSTFKSERVPINSSHDTDLKNDNDELTSSSGNKVALGENCDELLHNSQTAIPDKPNEQNDEETKFDSLEESKVIKSARNPNDKSTEESHSYVSTMDNGSKKTHRVHFCVDDKDNHAVEETGIQSPNQEDSKPKDLLDIAYKMKTSYYKSVALFCEDILQLIQDYLDDDEETRTSRKKAVQSARSIFVKQVEKVFPWYNIKLCRYWYSNKNMPIGMLPDSTLPPSKDHTYAQWLERMELPMSPQPSPFKKRSATPVKNLLPIDDDEGEMHPFLDGEDIRKCLFCLKYGDQDANDAGRLLYCGQDDWCHINCALWSAEVYEDADGTLQNLVEAYSRGAKLKCDRCLRYGATVGCNTRGCKSNYHFLCAREERCSFQEDKKVFCYQHRYYIDGELLDKNRFGVLRRVCVNTLNVRNTKKNWAKGLDAANISVLIGSCCVESLGRLTDLSDKPKVLQPVDFVSTRIYWSTRDARRRCVYTFRVVEVRPETLMSPIGIFKDTRIVHDEKHPDYIPLSQLDLSGINITLPPPKTPKPSICAGSFSESDTIDLTADSRNMSDTLSATENETFASSVVDTSCDKTQYSVVPVAGKEQTKLVRRASFSGIPSENAVSEEAKSLSVSWPRQSSNKPSQPKEVNLSFLSPKTLKMLNIKDPSKYMKPVQSGTVQEDEEFGLLKIADRLNNAAARSCRKNSGDRNSPQPLSGRSSRSPSVERSSPASVARSLSPVSNSTMGVARKDRSQSVDRAIMPSRPFSPLSVPVSRPFSPLPASVGKLDHSYSPVLSNLPDRPFSPPSRMLSRARSLSVDKEIQISKRCSPVEHTEPNLHTASILSPEPKPVCFSSPMVGSVNSVQKCEENEHSVSDIKTADLSSETSVNVDSADCKSGDIDSATENLSGELHLQLTDSSINDETETIVVMTDSGENLTDEEAIRIVQEVIEQRNSSAEGGLTDEDVKKDEPSSEENKDNEENILSVLGTAGDAYLESGDASGDVAVKKYMNVVENSETELQGDGEKINENFNLKKSERDTIQANENVLKDNFEEETNKEPRSESPFIPKGVGNFQISRNDGSAIRRDIRINTSVQSMMKDKVNKHCDDTELDTCKKDSEQQLQENNKNKTKDESEVIEMTTASSESDTDMLDITESVMKTIESKNYNESFDENLEKITEIKQDEEEIADKLKIDETPDNVENDLEKESFHTKEMSNKVIVIEDTTDSDSEILDYICSSVESCKTDTEEYTETDNLKTNQDILLKHSISDNDNISTQLKDIKTVIEISDTGDSDAQTQESFKIKPSNKDEIDGDHVMCRTQQKLKQTVIESNGKIMTSSAVKYLGIDVKKSVLHENSTKIDSLKSGEVNCHEHFTKESSVDATELYNEIKMPKEKDDEQNLEQTTNQSDDASKIKTVTSDELCLQDGGLEKGKDVLSRSNCSSDEERLDSEKQKVLRGLGLGTSDEVEKIKNSPTKTPSPVIPSNLEQNLEGSFRKTPIKTYPLRKHTVSPARYRIENIKHKSSSNLSRNLTRKRNISTHAEDNENMEDKSKNEMAELPVLDIISKKIKEESLAKSCAGDKGPFKCPTCRRMYRTEESYQVHVDNCDFVLSSSDDDKDDDSLKGDSGSNEKLTSRQRRRHESRLKIAKNLAAIEKKRRLSQDEEFNHLEEEKGGDDDKSHVRSSLRRSTMYQRVALEVEEKRMKEVAVKDIGRRIKGQQSLKDVIDDSEVNKREKDNESSSHSRSVNAAENDFVKKRGRGRPKKEFVEEAESIFPVVTVNTTSTNDIEAEKIKKMKMSERELRRVSRETKIIQNQSESSDSEPENLEHVSETFLGKRKRGRPRKSVEVEISTYSKYELENQTTDEIVESQSVNSDSEDQTDVTSTKLGKRKRGRRKKLTVERESSENETKSPASKIRTRHTRKSSKEVNELGDKEIKSPNKVIKRQTRQNSQDDKEVIINEDKSSVHKTSTRHTRQNSQEENVMNECKIKSPVNKVYTRHTKQNLHNSVGDDKKSADSFEMSKKGDNQNKLKSSNESHNRGRGRPRRHLKENQMVSADENDLKNSEKRQTTNNSDDVDTIENNDSDKEAKQTIVNEDLQEDKHNTDNEKLDKTDDVHGGPILDYTSGLIIDHKTGLILSPSGKDRTQECNKNNKSNEQEDIVCAENVTDKQENENAIEKSASKYSMPQKDNDIEEDGENEEEDCDIEEDGDNEEDCGMGGDCDNEEDGDIEDNQLNDDILIAVKIPNIKKHIGNEDEVEVNEIEKKMEVEDSFGSKDLHKGDKNSAEVDLVLNESYTSEGFKEEQCTLASSSIDEKHVESMNGEQVSKALTDVPMSHLPKTVLKLLKDGHKVVIKNSKLNKNFIWEKTESGYIGRPFERTIAKSKSKEVLPVKSGNVINEKNANNKGDSEIYNHTNDTVESTKIVKTSQTSLGDQKPKSASEIILAARTKAKMLESDANTQNSDIAAKKMFIEKNSKVIASNIKRLIETNKKTVSLSNQKICPKAISPLTAEYVGGVFISPPKPHSVTEVKQKIHQSATVATNLLQNSLLFQNQGVNAMPNMTSQLQYTPSFQGNISEQIPHQIGQQPSLQVVNNINFSMISQQNTSCLQTSMGNFAQTAFPTISQTVLPTITPADLQGMANQHMLYTSLQQTLNTTPMSYNFPPMPGVEMGIINVPLVPGTNISPNINPSVNFSSQISGGGFHLSNPTLPSNAIQSVNINQPPYNRTDVVYHQKCEQNNDLQRKFNVDSTSTLVQRSSSASQIPLTVDSICQTPASFQHPRENRPTSINNMSFVSSQRFEKLKKYLENRPIHSAKPIQPAAHKASNKMDLHVSKFVQSKKKRGRPKLGCLKKDAIGNLSVVKGLGFKGKIEIISPGKSLFGKKGKQKYSKWKKNGQAVRGCKTAQKKENIALPHSLGKSSHPIIHPQKEVTSLPVAVVEEEVRDVPLSAMDDPDSGQSGMDGRKQNMGHLEYEITSDDGFTCRADTPDGAWKQVTEKVQDARTASRLKQMSYAGLSGMQVFGLSHSSIVYLVEQLYGANYCRRYKFKYHHHELAEQELELVNPSGSIRTEQFNGRNTWDMFSFLMSRYRRLPQKADKVGDEEMAMKSSRRATSMGLPMAMRFRKLKEHSREAVGVYRSTIHGRGLFCKRNIDAGEMIIEYAGEVIRNSMTDIREKYYESKGIGCYMFRIDDFDVVDATMKGSAARFINHSCEPNCFSKVITVDNRKHIVIFAMQSIVRGEELTYDYKFPIEEVKIPCTCGSKKCRKYLN